LIINAIISACARSRNVPLDELDESYGLSRNNTAVYRRFYGLEQVVRSDEQLSGMLSNVLAQAVASVPYASSRRGQLIYCKTQTHNTFGDEYWLRRFANDHGLQSWETFSWTMTNCASALAAIHFVDRSSGDEPVIIMAGEKAFHPGISRLSVGLLAEIPTAAVLGGTGKGWQVLGTHVQHFGQFYENPDSMDPEHRKQLQEHYVDYLTTFLRESLSRFGKDSNSPFVFMPHNLNTPVTSAVVRHLGWKERVFYGDVSRQGHAYCSDTFVNLNALETTAADRLPRDVQVLVLAAGTGITFASCLLQRLAGPEATTNRDEATSRGTG
jgi:hypothetical protein